LEGGLLGGVAGEVPAHHPPGGAAVSELGRSVPVRHRRDHRRAPPARRPKAPGIRHREADPERQARRCYGIGLGLAWLIRVSLFYRSMVAKNAAMSRARSSGSSAGAKWAAGGVTVHRRATEKGCARSP